jgi:hypothetical protein
MGDPARKRPAVPWSTEALVHHARQHPCPDADPIHMPCPCGNAIALVCPSCSEPVFIAVRSDTWCEHAQELWEACG